MKLTVGEWRTVIRERYEVFNFWFSYFGICKDSAVCRVKDIDNIIEALNGMKDYIKETYKVGE